MGGCRDPRSDDLERLIESYDQMSRDIGWPGFDPGSIPLALHDTQGTYLIRHPSPPEAFHRLRGFRDVYGADTVLAELRANTDARIAGAQTATVLAPAEEWDAGALAPLLMHEAFHVYQTEAHPEWTANEVDLFTYPIRSAALLRLRRLETAALRRAVTAPDSIRELCWAQAFLRVRRDRFGRLPKEAAAYERGSELREGLARYVEARASKQEPQLPGSGFPPEDVRERAYASGHALAVLVDRLDPGWKTELSARDTVDAALDGLLRAAIGNRHVRRCGASPDDVGRSRTVALADLKALADRDARARDAFEGASGWRIRLDAARDPLMPQQFDPLNVRVLGGREVLHERWIQLAGDHVELEVLGRPALTHGVGPHPLFNGVDRFEVTGLPEPAIEVRGDTTSVRGGGVTLRLIGVELERGERSLTATLPRPDRRR